MGAETSRAAFGVDTSDEALEKKFAQVDTNSSGKIEAAECKAAIVAYYGACDDSTVAAMMKAADLDGDGEVDINEFKTIMRAHPAAKEAPKTVAEMDANLLGELVATCMDMVAQKTDGNFTRGDVMSALSSGLKTMKVEGDISTRKDEINKIMDDLMAIE